MPNMSPTRREFLTQMCRWRDSNNLGDANKWWDAVVETITREVYYNGSARLPGIGTISTKEIQSKYIRETDPRTGKKVTYFQPAKMAPIFIPEDDFVNDINMQGVTKAYRKRLKKGKLTQRDRERVLRADSVGIGEGVPEESIRKAEEDFEEMLKAKRRKSNNLKIGEDE